MQRFFLDWEAWLNVQLEDHLHQMESFLGKFEMARRQFRKGRGDFNLFYLLGLGTDEVRHSAFLAWLFDPSAAHGQGDQFLRAFLEVARPQITLRLPQTYRVQTELSRMASIVDIAAFQSGDFIVFVENKTVSPDTRGQHDREIEDLRRMGVTLQVPLKRQYPIYLTPHGRPAQGEYHALWHCVAYSDLGFSFSNFLQEVSDERTRLLLEDWLDATRSFGGVGRYKMSKLSQSSILLGSNWSTVLSIEKALEDLEAELLSLLYSVEDLLIKQDWWQGGWSFGRGKSQIWIDNIDWADAKGNWPLWMGVYRFKPDHVFGPKAAPIFYFRARKNYETLGNEFREALRAEGHKVLEDHRHLVHRAIQQCPHDQAAVEAYPAQVQEQIVELFTEYADFAMQREDSIRIHVKSKYSSVD